jgi:hypothetical protein
MYLFYLAGEPSLPTLLAHFSTSQANQLQLGNGPKRFQHHFSRPCTLAQNLVARLHSQLWLGMSGVLEQSFLV